MTTQTALQAAVDDFLAQRCLAVAGVSRTPGQAANAIYRRLKEAGYRVYPVNPHADEVEGDRCYPSLEALPERPGGVLVATPPEAAEALVEACARLGIERVWMHRSFGTGSVSEAATARAQALGLTVIPGACPLLFLDPVDPVHRCFRGWLRLTGRLPEPRGTAATA